MYIDTHTKTCVYALAFAWTKAYMSVDASVLACVRATSTRTHTHAHTHIPGNIVPPVRLHHMPLAVAAGMGGHDVVDAGTCVCTYQFVGVGVGVGVGVCARMCMCVSVCLSEFDCNAPATRHRAGNVCVCVYI